MSNTHQEYDDRFIRRHKQLFAQAKERRDKQLVEQQEIQSVQEKIKQQLLAMVDLKAHIEVFKNADNAVAKTTNTSIKNTNGDKLSADEEQYQTTIVQKMVALIKQRKMK